MKKLFAVFLVVCIIFGIAGCSQKSDPVIEPDNPVVEPDDPVVEPGPVYYNPLTGEETETDISTNRPFAIMLNTIYQALPQSGNSKADIYIEMCEEGGITRVMGLYQDITGVGPLGSIRSCREYFLALAMSFDALIVHDGGDVLCYNYTIVDQKYKTLSTNHAPSGIFYRDQERLKTMAYEHTEFTTSDKLQNYLVSSGIRAEHEENYTQVLQFTENGTPDGDNATYVKAVISGYKNTVFEYDESTKKYNVFFWDNEPYIDAGYDNTQINVTNVLILTCQQYTKYPANDKARQAYAMDEGVGYYISGGKYIEVKFTKSDYNKNQDYGAPLSITTLDGTPLEMNVGKTYMIIMDKDNSITIK